MHKMQLAKLAKSKRNFTDTVVKENKGKFGLQLKVGGGGGGAVLPAGDIKEAKEFSVLFLSPFFINLYLKGQQEADSAIITKKKG